MNTGQRRLAITILVTCVVWGLALPALARHPVVRERSRWLHERGIEPAAIYYADHPLADRVLDRWDQQRRR